MKWDNTDYVSALSVDVEDGVNIAMKDYFNITMDPTERVMSNIDTTLMLFEKNNVKATFFILGEVVKKYPELLKRIDQEGHEIGVHGYHHDQIFKLTPHRLKEELSKAKRLMEDVIGKPIYGFRAPAFSIDQKTSWALPILAEAGFAYDSSIFPSRSLRYGWDGFSKDICRIKLGKSLSIVEVPLSVTKLLGRDVPTGGGGYLRYLPLWWTKRAMRGIVKERPAILYFHPYELDTKKYPNYFYEALRLASYRRQLQLKFYRFRKATVESKLESLIKEFPSAPLLDVITHMGKRIRIPEVSLTDLITK